MPPVTAAGLRRTARRAALSPHWPGNCADIRIVAGNGVPEARTQLAHHEKPTLRFRRRSQLKQYFQSLATTPYTLRGIERFKIRWPKDRLLERGSTTLAIDLDPNTSMRQLGMVSFTACTSMSDNFYSMSYEKCHREFETVYCGERSISIVEMLRWLSIIGREKDLETVEHILPVAANAGLVSNEQMASIQVEYDRSVNARGTQPQRYYSRNT